MRVLGIDPGSYITGYGIVDSGKGKLFHVSDGSIVTGSKKLLASRLHSIFDNIQNIVKEFKPDNVVIEEIFYAKNARSAIMLGHARGVAILCAAQHNLPVFEYSPMKIKQAVVGYGNATKEQVQKMVKALLKLDAVPRPDASDALAAAICHIHHTTVYKPTSG
ncbi:MAG: crossover junction endodeoxyribonuclease RuvC [Deltaproteobacteria bacterium]|nr:crossover junction endodeoxyribonuclease RuvC [Deltaproteobacteria bacterium]